MNETQHNVLKMRLKMLQEKEELYENATAEFSKSKILLEEAEENLVKALRSTVGYKTPVEVDGKILMLFSRGGWGDRYTISDDAWSEDRNENK